MDYSMNEMVNVAPWDEVTIDLIGPWTIEINNQKYEFNALTCIDPVSNLVELIRINNKTAKQRIVTTTERKASVI
jgi:hypothetical protein